MLSNLLVYGLSLALGGIASYAYADSMQKRSILLLASTLLVPLYWIVTMRTFNVELLLPRMSGRAGAILFILPLFWSFSFGSSFFFEINRLRNRDDR
ncbi:hypothetical protein [Pelagicoccus mobilis]|uniref:Uncharacterized protein n=1 Tax=Pelagicoccus mobilis TaxID=415221 RepID=A0A934VKK4_9BACT|nr:hypothetical protein [Pelagicoccus mobilis]MBK1876786.1 hypothetical protein [Pelagicoccus mobilis]